MAGRKPGTAKTGGRKKGTPNKVTSDVKGMILEALNEVGGVKYLVTQASLNPTAFMTLVGKVLPMQTELSGPNGGNIPIGPSAAELSEAIASKLAGIASAKRAG